MKLTVFSSDGKTSSEKDFANIPTFEGDKGLQAVKEVIVAINANNRQGTHSTKTRGEVRGGGKKPWRQKGTGRARAGSIRSPLWVGGGVVFGPKPRDYSKKINNKVKQLAFSRALFDRVTAGELAVIEAFDTNIKKTKAINEVVGRIVRQFCDAEVEHFHPCAHVRTLRDENVRRLEIAVDDPGLVRRRNCCRRL
jgi:large subunit ribosomal protein L4